MTGVSWSVTWAALSLAGCCLGLAGPSWAAEATCRPTLTTPWGTVTVFPANNPWNQDVSKLPVHPKSATWIKAIGADVALHPDFGTVWDGAPIGIPTNTVPPTQPTRPITFTYASESDPGPYPSLRVSESPSLRVRVRGVGNRRAAAAAAAAGPARLRGRAGRGTCGRACRRPTALFLPFPAAL